MGFKVELTYFKESGKFYACGEYESNKSKMHEIFDEVRAMLESGNCPGLVDGKCEFYALINVPEHPNYYPHLYVPGKTYPPYEKISFPSEL